MVNKTITWIKKTLKRPVMQFKYELDWILRMFKWYRRKKGGKWYRVRPDFYGVYDDFWIHSGESLRNMTILETEEHFHS